MNLANLLALWATRDYRYTMRRHALSPQEIDSVTAWRMVEVKELPTAEQPRAMAEVALFRVAPPNPERFRPRGG